MNTVLPNSQNDKRSKRVADNAEYSSMLQRSLEGLTEIGDINFMDFNNADSGVTQIDIVFENAKPEGFYLDKIFLKNTEEFESEDYGYYATGEITSITLKNSTPASIDILGSKIPAFVAEDITLEVVLSAENTNDWSAGNIKVYALLKAHPIA